MTLVFPLTTLTALLLFSSFVLGGNRTLSKRVYHKQGIALQHINGRNLSASMDHHRVGRHRFRRACYSPMVTYVVQVHTGTREGASTDADIYVYLYGDECTHNGTFLDTPDWDDFEPGQTDQFMFDRRSVGDLLYVALTIPAPDTWFVEYIRITAKQESKTWVANYNMWIMKKNHYYKQFVTPA